MPGPDPVTAMAEGHADPEPAFLEVLAEAVDRGGADLVLHGHAHRGSERGETAGGVPVRNVAWPVTGRPYTVFHFEQSAGRVSVHAGVPAPGPPGLGCSASTGTNERRARDH